jgi:pyrimidine-nucleoside phosphorylase
MIALGEMNGCQTVALLTAMDRPLGYACGNALEIEESIAGLRGEGPADLMTVTLALGVEMLLAGGVTSDRADARRRLQATIQSGSALAKLRELIAAQDGNPAIVDDPGALPQAPHRKVFMAPREGIVSEVLPRVIGRAIIRLGGGRTKVDDEVDPAVGFVITAKPGDRVTRGQPLATIYAREAQDLVIGTEALAQAVVIGDAVPAPLPLVSHRVTAQGVEALA